MEEATQQPVTDKSTIPPVVEKGTGWDLNPWLWHPYLTVFLSSACIMILELVAGRIIAPYVGVSLYTWTSVIGVVLAGIRPVRAGGSDAGSCVP